MLCLNNAIETFSYTFMPAQCGIYTKNAAFGLGA